ncbi:collagen alpha-1(I) chain-like isoform X2 [Panicum virgatum]|uniref:Uncharacterized protein n=1 Tax=Panicum virgatum TaxID=38727 RepID=A0A8T0T718_PANVG|nr:collagen alpha-1(I) chain-like isoform X2 [Panicum virgatum]KAG2607532.1 hypothetical protein PVAP13_4NG252200 [Panicum virgatum]
MTAVDAEPYAVVATAADIICSLRGADLAGWTPPWRKGAGAPDLPPACDGSQEAVAEEGDPRGLAWPAVARGKRSRSRRAGSPSASGSASASAGPAAVASKEDGRKKKPRRGARGSPASPLDYSGSGASTSGGEDGAFCSQPAAPAAPAAAAAAAAAAPSSKRLPEIQQLVRSLSVENDALREEMKALQRACTALSKENGKIETRIDHSSKQNKGKPQHGHERVATEQDAQNGFVLPDLNLPADD